MSIGKRYTITFYKTVTPDHGDDREIVERAVDVVAPDEREAARRAQAAFCEAEGIADWSMRADRFEIAPGDASS